MRLQYRILTAVAALFVAAAVLYPMQACAGIGDDQKPKGASCEHAEAAQELNQFDTPPRLLDFVQPSYPEEAMKLGVTSTVLLSLVVGEKGNVKKARVIEVSDIEVTGEKEVSERKLEKFEAAFRKSALKAAKTWVFEPARLKGEPVKATIAMPVNFKLN